MKKVELFKGVLPPEYRDQLHQPFPADAISKIDSKSYLSSIKAIYIIERLNDVFGLGGWNFSHEILNDSDDYVTITGFISVPEFDYLTPQQYGGHKKSGKGTEPADGYKSAVTDCLTKCGSFLEIGIQVFKGVQTHENKTVAAPPKPLPAGMIAIIEPLVASNIFTEDERKKIDWSEWDENTGTDMISRLQAKAKKVKADGVSAGQIEVINFLFGQGLHDEKEQGLWMDDLTASKTYAAGEKVVKALEDQTTSRYQEMNEKETV